MRRWSFLFCALSAVFFAQPRAQAPPRTAVILVTLDGARHQELFGGLDVEILRSTLREGQSLEQQPSYRQYWAATPQERREKLMPFFWRTLMRQHGSIAGNQALGSRVHVTNAHWFSYPGYSEMLVGRPYDEDVKSNDPIRNPRPTVLEFLRERAQLSRLQVGVFASWSVFSAIAEHTEGALTINAGAAAWESPDAEVRRHSALQLETQTPWDSVRHDAYTFRFALDHLQRARPRVMYLALGETDDWAHDGRYDRVLQAYTRSDEYLQRLWTWLHEQPDYRGQTSLLITTDHGRGATPRDWRDHGKDTPGSGETWMAFISPASERRGEWRSHAPVTSSQVAATLIRWMGLDPSSFAGAAPPVVDPPASR
jgi:hypothetical protein